MMMQIWRLQLHSKQLMNPTTNQEKSGRLYWDNLIRSGWLRLTCITLQQEPQFQLTCITLQQGTQYLIVQSASISNTKLITNLQCISRKRSANPKSVLQALTVTTTSMWKNSLGTDKFEVPNSVQRCADFTPLGVSRWWCSYWSC